MGKRHTDPSNRRLREREPEAVQRTTFIDPTHMAYSKPHRAEMPVDHLTPFARRCLGLAMFPTVAVEAPARGKRGGRKR